MSLQIERFDLWRWMAVPMLLCIGGTLVLSAPIRAFGLHAPEPVLPLVPAFAWAVVRPSVLGPAALLVLGLFLDLIWGGALGLWPLALMAAYGLVVLTRHMMTGQSRMMMWAWFAAACLTAMMTAYVIVALDAKALPDPLAVFWQWAPTVLLYPFSHRLIERFEDADIRFR